jgi:hypothetical protein
MTVRLLDFKKMYRGLGAPSLWSNIFSDGEVKKCSPAELLQEEQQIAANKPRIKGILKYWRDERSHDRNENEARSDEYSQDTLQFTSRSTSGLASCSRSDRNRTHFEDVEIMNEDNFEEEQRYLYDPGGCNITGQYCQQSNEEDSDESVQYLGEAEGEQDAVFASESGEAAEDLDDAEVEAYHGTEHDVGWSGDQLPEDWQHKGDGDVEDSGSGGIDWNNGKMVPY